MSKDAISIKALTTIQSATGDILKEKNAEGKELSTGRLTMTTEDGPVILTIDQFDSLYRGLVNCWPAVKPVKDKLIEIRREETKLAKAAEKEAQEAAKKAEKEAAKAKREEEKAAEKKAKEEAAAKAKAEKEAAAKKAAEDKKKADMEKAKKAAADKAKADKAAAAKK